MIRIPDAALKAGAQEITLALMHVVDEDAALPLTDDERAELARAAFLAMIEAWPGMFEEYMNDEDGDGASLCVILPLEASDE